MSLTSRAIVAAVAVIGISACDKASPMSPSADSSPAGSGTTASLSGNGAPNGAHYNLNLIGVPRSKTAEMTGNNGGRIFIYYEGSTDILLSPGPYQVLDANGTDGTASFQLPNPNGGTSLAYSVWIRPVAGKGEISFQSCFTEKSTGLVWCYAGSLVQKLTKNTKFTDVSRDLLQVCADVDASAGVDLELVPLFDDRGEEYFWHVDNDGMRNVQMRFYDISTTPIGGDCTRGSHPTH